MIYHLRESVDHTEIGNSYPQIQEYDIDDLTQPKIFDVNFYGKFDPPIKLPRYKMESKSKITDLISSSPLSLAFLKVSDNLFDVLTSLSLPSTQFFDYEFIYKKKIYSNYKAIYYAKDIVYNDFINWDESEFFKTKDYHKTIIDQIKFKDYESMITFEKSIDRDKFGFLSLIRINYSFEFDIFNFRDHHFPSGFFCTEKVKNQVEKQGFTGFNFEPVEDGIFI